MSSQRNILVRATVAEHDGTAAPEACAVWREGGAEAVDLRTPRDAAMEDEEPVAQPIDRSAIFREMWGYFFGDGPDPAKVLRRVWALAEGAVPEWLASVGADDRRLIASGELAAIERRWIRPPRRVAYWRRKYQRSRKDPRPRAVAAVLAAAWKNAGRPAAATYAVRLEDLLHTKQGEQLADFERRQQIVHGWLQMVCVDGVRPERMVRNVFSLAKTLAPQAVLRMSLAAFGELFVEERATWSWRGKKWNRRLAWRGAQGVRAPYQKSALACLRYARAAQGNRNRVHGRAA